MLVGLSKKQYQIDPKPFSSGGEGDIYRVIGQEKIVMKIYHADRRTQEMEAKITHMAGNPPSESVLTQVAWPLDAVYDERGAFVGFVMPKLKITAELGKVYEYPSKTNITFKQKLILAENICVVIHAVHDAGYVFGDFNPRNIGIDLQTGMVAFLDTDSYHIVLDREKDQAYRCSVCAPGYCAPELLSKCADHITAHPEDSTRAYAKTPLDTFTRETDNFALAIHMFRLLMNGFSPYGGIRETESASVGSPGVGDAAVRRDSYCFKKGNKPQSSAVPPMTIHPKSVQKLFARAFIDGRKHPEKRPSAYEWHRALGKYEEELTQCEKCAAHYYRKELKSCPWCDADEKYRQSISPRPTMQQKAFGAAVTGQNPPVPPQNRSQSAWQQPASRRQGNASGTSGTGTTVTLGFSPKQPLLNGGLFKAATLFLYIIGWISFFGVAAFALKPFVSNGSFHFSKATLMGINGELVMLLSAAAIFLVTLGSACHAKSLKLAYMLSAVWGLAVCTAWSLMKTGFPGLRQGDMAGFPERCTVSVLGLFCILYFGSQSGKSLRKNYFRRLFVRPALGSKEIGFILAGLAVTGSYIWLLADLPLFFRIITKHNLSLPILFASPAILYGILGKGRKYGTKFAFGSLTGTATVTFFTSFLLWITTLEGDAQNTLMIVMAVAGIIVVRKLHKSIGGSMPGLTFLFMLTEYVSLVFPQIVSLQSHTMQLGEKAINLTALPPTILWVFTMLLLGYEIIRK